MRQIPFQVKDGMGMGGDLRSTHFMLHNVLEEVQRNGQSLGAF